MERKTIRLDDDIAIDIEAIAARRRCSENQIMLEALRLYRDRDYMQSKATVINDDVIAILQASCKIMENSINNKSNRVLSEVAIQMCIQNLILARSLQISQSDLTTFRLRGVEFLKDNQRVFRLDEAVED